MNQNSEIRNGPAYIDTFLERGICQKFHCKQTVTITGVTVSEFLCISSSLHRRHPLHDEGVREAPVDNGSICLLSQHLTGIVQGDHSTCSKPPVDFKIEVPFWPGQGRTGQAKTELFL